MWTIQAGCFNRACTLRDAKFFYCSCNEQDSQYRRNQATLNIQVVKRFLTEKARQGDWQLLGSCRRYPSPCVRPCPRLSGRATSESLSWLASGELNTPFKSQDKPPLAIAMVVTLNGERSLRRYRFFPSNPVWLPPGL